MVHRLIVKLYSPTSPFALLVFVSPVNRILYETIFEWLSETVVGPRSNSAFSTATLRYNATTLAAKNGGLILPRSRRKLRRTVIIVDDDTSMLRAIARLMRADGFEVLAFDRPSLLLAADIPESNACLVLDVNLPEMDGVELYETMAASGRRLPVIMITGRNDSKTRRLIERVKAVSVLLKPFDDTAFLEVIYRALSISK